MAVFSDPCPDSDSFPGVCAVFSSAVRLGRPVLADDDGGSSRLDAGGSLDTGYGCNGVGGVWRVCVRVSWCGSALLVAHISYEHGSGTSEIVCAGIVCRVYSNEIEI